MLHSFSPDLSWIECSDGSAPTTAKPYPELNPDSGPTKTPILTLIFDELIPKKIQTLNMTLIQTYILTSSQT